MPYSSFTVAEVEEKFHVNFQQGKIFDEIAPITLSERLLYSLEDAQLFYLDNEKIKSEAVLFPVMEELMRKNTESISIFSGKRLDVDSNLVGECDFLIASIPHLVRLKAPIIFVIEAKSDNIDYGLAQCSAQMLGSTQIIKENLHEEIISFIAPKIIGNSTNVINNLDIFIIDNAIEFADIDYFRINYQYE